MSNRKFAKVDRVRRLMNEDMRVLASRDTNQVDKIHALRNQEARRRQEPLRSQEHKYRGNGMSNLIPPEGPRTRPSVMDETRTQPSSAYGYPTVQGAYQQFSGYNVQTTNRGQGHTGNISNFGYDSEQSDRQRALAYFDGIQQYGNAVAPASGPRSAIAEMNARPEGPISFLERTLSARDLQYIGEVVQALVRQQEGQKQSRRVVFERYEQTNRDYTQEQLFLIAHKMGLIQEKYESTAGQWVVTMPWANPQTPEQLLYNQKGFSQFNYEQLEKQQQGNYYTHNDEVYHAKKTPQVPPATPQNQSQAVEYTARNNRSAASLRNPKRGDDYIRNHRLTMEEKQELAENLAWRDELTQEEHQFFAQYIRTLQEEIKQMKRDYNAGIGKSMVPVRKKEKQLNAIKAKVTSSRAMRKEREMNAKRKAASQRAINQTTMGVSNLNRGSASQEMQEARAVQAYNRHLNLLESANRYLSSNQGRGNYQGLNQNY